MDPRIILLTATITLLLLTVTFLVVDHRRTPPLRENSEFLRRAHLTLGAALIADVALLATSA